MRTQEVFGHKVPAWFSAYILVIFSLEMDSSMDEIFIPERKRRKKALVNVKENVNVPVNMDDSMEDFIVPKTVRKPLVDLSNVKSAAVVENFPKKTLSLSLSLSSKRGKNLQSGQSVQTVVKSDTSAIAENAGKYSRHVGTQCGAGVQVKDKATQIGNEKAVSYNKTSEHITYRKLIQSIIHTKSATIHFCMDVGLIPKMRLCPTCNSPMNMINDAAVSDGHRWYCRVRKGPEKHEHRLSLRTGTFFEKSNMTLEEILQFMYMWVNGRSQKNISHELGSSDNTDVDWASFCREVCEVSVFKSSEKVGGPGVVVEIDESKFAKRMYNVGHRVQGGWVFGGREKDNKKKIFMEPVENRTAETLLAIIQKWVAPGSVIWSDCWKSYNRIPELPEGYSHATVNHSSNFVDPATGTCTNRIESDWRHAKAIFPKFGTKPDMYQSYLGVFMWRRRNEDTYLFRSLCLPM